MPLVIENPPSSRASNADEERFAAACRGGAFPPAAPETTPAEGVPKGEVRTLAIDGSEAYPETRRDVRIYVPAQYDPARPANLVVFQDGLFYLAESFNAPAVFDTLIARGELPPTVGVFVEPGDLIGYPAGGRHNRSIEYDDLSDAYVRLLLGDVLPQATAGLNITSKPAGRVLCGMSSGGIAAFTAAWHRPDQFGAVISHCGSFTNLRGGGAFPSMVRMEHKRPIRVFLQSGANDMNRVVGSWAVANHDMAAALALKGYDYRFEFGEGGHTLHHGAAIFPETLRWIFR